MGNKKAFLIFLVIGWSVFSVKWSYDFLMIVFASAAIAIGLALLVNALQSFSLAMTVDMWRKFKSTGQGIFIFFSACFAAVAISAACVSIFGSFGAFQGAMIENVQQSDRYQTTSALLAAEQKALQGHARQIDNDKISRVAARDHKASLARIEKYKAELDSISVKGGGTAAVAGFKPIQNFFGIKSVDVAIEKANQVFAVGSETIYMFLTLVLVVVFGISPTEMWQGKKPENPNYAAGKSSGAAALVGWLRSLPGSLAQITQKLLIQNTGNPVIQNTQNPVISEHSKSTPVAHFTVSPDHTENSDPEHSKSSVPDHTQITPVGSVPDPLPDDYIFTDSDKEIIAACQQFVHAAGSRWAGQPNKKLVAKVVHKNRQYISRVWELFVRRGFQFDPPNKVSNSDIAASLMNDDPQRIGEKHQDYAAKVNQAIPVRRQRLEELKKFLEDYPDASLAEMGDAIGVTSRERVRELLNELGALDRTPAKTVNFFKK